ncbi:opacity protein-like surface antigen [Sinobacterium caligoides]|uniref:Opacity protein-like surface antigen n=1 Tax=Sinobacterium caligoides TaxID=933926 RepID=A0A3N2DQN3_9GAMM|nr:outer membrane beta-barrel protein [Sinobacterium caligoides]ROS01615.1 opacity protein-like surface antigen [Sinobacterium caligoides]
MKKVLTALILPVTLASSAAVLADSGFYASGAVSYADHTASIKENGIHSDDLEEAATGYNITAGYQFNTFFGLEASYYDFGSVDGKQTANGRNYKSSSDSSAFGVAAVGTLPLGESWKLYGKLGAAQSRNNLKVAWEDHENPDESGSTTLEDNGFTPYYGAGVSYAVVPNAEIYLEAMQFAYSGEDNSDHQEQNTEFDSDVLNTSLGIRLRF